MNRGKKKLCLHQNFCCSLSTETGHTEMKCLAGFWGFVCNPYGLQWQCDGILHELLTDALLLALNGNCCFAGQTPSALFILTSFSITAQYQKAGLGQSTWQSLWYWLECCSGTEAKSPQSNSPWTCAPAHETIPWWRVVRNHFGVLI